MRGTETGGKEEKEKNGKSSKSRGALMLSSSKGMDKRWELENDSCVLRVLVRLLTGKESTTSRLGAQVINEMYSLIGGKSERC